MEFQPTEHCKNAQRSEEQHHQLYSPAGLVRAAGVHKDGAPGQHAGEGKVLDKAYAIAFLGDCPNTRAHNRLTHTALLFALQHATSATHITST